MPLWLLSTNDPFLLFSSPFALPPLLCSHSFAAGHPQCLSTSAHPLSDLILAMDHSHFHKKICFIMVVKSRMADSLSIMFPILFYAWKWIENEVIKALAKPLPKNWIIDFDILSWTAAIHNDTSALEPCSMTVGFCVCVVMNYELATCEEILQVGRRRQQGSTDRQTKIERRTDR